jgi:hypothetical protein
MDAGPLPAKCMPAMPEPVSLKAEPGELDAFPGSTGALLVRQLKPAVVPGWPVVGVWMAPAIPAGASPAAVVSAVIARARRTFVIFPTSA